MTLSTTAKPFTENFSRRIAATNSERSGSMDLGHLNEKIQNLHKELSPAPGVHSRNCMKSAGFKYVNNGDTVQCNSCNLTVSQWTTDMDPFTVHKMRSPSCKYVQSMLSSAKKNRIPAYDVEEPPSKRMKLNESAPKLLCHVFNETHILKQVRLRSFSHWPHRSSPSSSQMIQAGFFNCNVGDRVICIYCNLICQQWAPNNEDPYEVHKKLSPKCVYVNAMLTSSVESTSPLSIINEVSLMTNINSIDSHTIVHTAACNPNYIEIPKRTASFVNWPNENAPSVDDLVKAGFFFTGTKTVVTCFYCNGSLQNWGANDNPMIEHARWFPHCAYAKQLCGTELYQKIQESKRILQEIARINNSSGQSNTNSGSMNVGRLVIPDETTLSRLVAARLDLSVSQSLLNRNFKLSIIKRCWEDQLRLKHDDFNSDCDLWMACTILRKQIEVIDGKKENIVVPNVAMERSRTETLETGKITNAHTISNENCTQTRIDDVTNFISCDLCSVNDWHSALLPCHHT